MADEAPSDAEIADLKRLTAGIIRAQGNRFIKVLLREKKKSIPIPIGTNKADFERNLNRAIEKGDLRLAEVEKWLKDVEGWGNQHVYLFNISTSLRKELTKPKIQQKVEAKSELAGVWDKTTVMEFPDEPTLTSISFESPVLRLVWQEAAPTWVAAPELNFLWEDDLDTIEYRAYRKVEWRSIDRFEAHLDLGLAGIFIARPIQEEGHEKALAEVQRVLGALDIWPALDRTRCNLRDISKNLDQRNVPTNRNSEPSVRAQKSRLSSGGSYVEFAANDSGKAYWEAPAVQDVRNAVRSRQLADFEGTEGVFLFQTPRPVRVQLYGKDNRIRFRAEMVSSEVWSILQELSTYQ